VEYGTLALTFAAPAHSRHGRHRSEQISRQDGQDYKITEAQYNTGIHLFKYQELKAIERTKLL
jgi:hypothetical protein